MFSPEMKSQIVSTVFRLRTKTSALTVDFYNRLFRAAPDLRLLFRDDMQAQADKLYDMILTLVQALDDMQPLVPELEMLGCRHAGYGVKDEHYPILTEQLIATLADNVDGWNDRDREAWEELIGFVADLMITGARDVQATGS
ncbi:flavohemoprotein [Salipiger pallidus]|uniref:Flavohemoprotein n=1 Tax=Salipiger pallidus TaxID=1775170 RepID=A0A8J3EFU2_9RHOB|nr:globin domain-containing protein [Salipiger pallidus]GGG66836.1 flavohemoprotein [Salipiger pallidus]